MSTLSVGSICFQSPASPSSVVEVGRESWLQKFNNILHQKVQLAPAGILCLIFFGRMVAVLHVLQANETQWATIRDLATE